MVGIQQSCTLKKGAIASGGNYIFNILKTLLLQSDVTTGIAVFDNVMIQEGSLSTSIML